MISAFTIRRAEQQSSKPPANFLADFPRETVSKISGIVRVRGRHLQEKSSNAPASRREVSSRHLFPQTRRPRQPVFGHQQQNPPHTRHIIMVNGGLAHGKRMQDVQPEDTVHAGGWVRLNISIDSGLQRWRNSFRPRPGRGACNRSKRNQDRPAGPHAPLPVRVARCTDAPVRLACLRNIVLSFAWDFALQGCPSPYGSRVQRVARHFAADQLGPCPHVDENTENTNSVLKRGEIKVTCCRKL